MVCPLLPLASHQGAPVRRCCVLPFNNQRCIVTSDFSVFWKEVCFGTELCSIFCLPLLNEIPPKMFELRIETNFCSNQRAKNASHWRDKNDVTVRSCSDFSSVRNWKHGRKSLNKPRRVFSFVWSNHMYFVNIRTCCSKNKKWLHKKVSQEVMLHIFTYFLRSDETWRKSVSVLGVPFVYLVFVAFGSAVSE